MSVDFTKIKCQKESNKRKFGLCDDQPPLNNPAYIDENDGSKWIAIVINDNNFDVTFTAIDNCISLIRDDGRMAKRCDGVLFFDDTVIFVELKERGSVGNQWVVDAEKQLKETILFFEKEDVSNGYQNKKAYISNKLHPKFKNSQKTRMEKFYNETNYVLLIVNRINL